MISVIPLQSRYTLLVIVSRLHGYIFAIALSNSSMDLLNKFGYCLDDFPFTGAFYSSLNCTGDVCVKKIESRGQD